MVEKMGWVKKVLEYFGAYRPTLKSMTINYRNLAGEVSLLLHVPDQFRRNITMIEIPAYQNFQIADMMDEGFSRIGNLWQFQDGRWRLDPSQLPKSEKFLVMMRGELPRESLSQIVRVQPATNRDQTEEFDRYWLDAMIRNVDILEQMWQDLEVEDVNNMVKIGVERCFYANVPKEARRRLKAVQRWISVGHGRSRQDVFSAWTELRQASRRMEIPVDRIVEIVYGLTTGELFTEFVSVDRPYQLGEVKREEQVVELFPKRMMVEAVTRLSLKQPTATGYVMFKKKEYNDKIRESFPEPT